MAVNTQNITSGPYNGDGVNDTFSYTFRIDETSEVAAYESVNGVDTLLTLNTDYTVLSVGDDNGGLIKRTAGALPVGNQWYIRADYKPTQVTVFASQGGFFPQVHDYVMDKLTFLMQQVMDRVSRSIRLSDSDLEAGSASLTLPKITARANKLLAFDGAGNVVADTFAMGDIASVIVDNVTTLRTGTPVNGSSVLLQSHTTLGDDGGGLFEARVGAAAGTYVDNNGTVIVPTGGDGSAAFLRVFNTISPQMFGAVGDGSTDDTDSVQNAINAAATNGSYAVFLPKGIYLVSTIYFYYDATLNQGFPASTYDQGRVSMFGQRHVSGQTIVAAQPLYGSVIKTSSPASSAIMLGNGTAKSTAVELKDLTVIGTTTAALVDMNLAPQMSNLENLTLHNNGVSGVCLHVRGGCWTTSFRNIYATGAGGGRTGVGFKIDSSNLCTFDNLTASYMDLGFEYGVSTTSDNDVKGGQSSTFTSIQSTNCNNGAHFKGGSNITINGLWLEQGTGDFDLKIDNGGRGYTITGLLVNSSSTTLANVVLGNNTGTSWTDRCQNIILVNSRFGFVDTIGLIKYTGCNNLELKNPSFKNNGGKAVAIENGVIGKTIITSPNWFPQGASAQIAISSRIVDPATLASHRERVTLLEGTIAPLIGASTTDMSSWLTIPRLISSATSGGIVTIILPTANMIGSKMTVWQQYIANQTDLDAGAGTIDGVVGVTTITAAYSKITIQNVAAGKWITV